MHKTYLLTIIFFLPLFLVAQKAENKKAEVFITPAYESVYSTHGNFFYSKSIRATKFINKKLELGIGIEKAFSPKHHDNGFVIYRLKFVPVYSHIKYNFVNASKWCPFVESSLGVSFNKYKIASDETPTEKSKVNEVGVFVYTGVGTKYLLSKNISLVSALGFKGYKMSFNVYDINPHGVTYLVGLGFKLS